MKSDQLVTLDVIVKEHFKGNPQEVSKSIIKRARIKNSWQNEYYFSESLASMALFWFIKILLNTVVAIIPSKDKKIVAANLVSIKTSI